MTTIELLQPTVVVLDVVVAPTIEVVEIGNLAQTVEVVDVGILSGQRGPAGPTGAQGAQGIQGIPGPQGPPGTKVIAVPYAEWPPVNPLPDVLYLRIAP